MTYRLGINLGTNSIGWCALDCDADGNPIGIRDGGVRVYSSGCDPKTGASLAVDRRTARAKRRRRDRYLRRRAVLMEEMIRIGLMPADAEARKELESTDPYRIRIAALDEKVPAYFLGRALFHLNQRRGFKSNPKSYHARSDPEIGIVAEGIDNLDAAMSDSGARTHGEYLARRQSLKPDEYSAADRRIRICRDESTGDFPFYPSRRHLEAEFEALWKAQELHHPHVLTASARNRLRQIMFFQRQIKSSPIGRCIYTAEQRMAKAHPLFQRLLLVKAINELAVEFIGGEIRRLTLRERDAILCALRSSSRTKRTITWSAMRRAAGLPQHSRFKGEELRKTGIVGDEVEAQMVKAYGSSWRTFSFDEQWHILKRLRDEENDDTLQSFLRKDVGVDESRLEAIIGLRLPTGIARIGETAATRILTELQNEVISEREALSRCRWDNSSPRTDQLWDNLPYYGEVIEYQISLGTQNPTDPPEECYGRIANPAVHIGLGQLRRVVNAIIEQYGIPLEIFVELARDLKFSDKRKQENDRINKRDKKAAILRGQKLEALGVDNTGGNRAILRLWEELHIDPRARQCVYSGKPIGLEMLFSDEIEIDYILPIRETLDDTSANKLVCIADVRREKRSNTPHQAFGATSKWPAIVARAGNLPTNKRWRFASDALTRFGQKRGFLANQLTETQPLSRLVQMYLEALYCGSDREHERVRAISGRLTEMLRRNWKLNSLLPDHNHAQTNKRKSRLDHRHLLIDAFVAAMTDQRMMQQVAIEAARHDELGSADLFRDMPEPWGGFREHLQAHLDRMTVSHKPDHGSFASANDKAIGRDRTVGRLHNDTAYGLTAEKDANGNEIVVNRVPLLSLGSETKIATVRDDHLRAELASAIQDTCDSDREAALLQFSAEHPVYRDIRRVRVTAPRNTVKVHDTLGRAYKGYMGNSIHHIDIWRLPDGKWVSKWKDRTDRQISSAVQTFNAHATQLERQELRPHPAAKKILSLQQNDLIALDHPHHGDCICRVVKISGSGQITLARHMEAGDLIRRNKSTEDPFKYYSPTAGGLKKARARQVRVDAIGRVWDPGPRD